MKETPILDSIHDSRTGNSCGESIRESVSFFINIAVQNAFLDRYFHAIKSGDKIAADFWRDSLTKKN